MVFGKLMNALSGVTSDVVIQEADVLEGVFVVPDDVPDDWNPGYVPSADEPEDFDEHSEGEMIV